MLEPAASSLSSFVTVTQGRHQRHETSGQTSAGTAPGGVSGPRSQLLGQAVTDAGVGAGGAG